MILHTIEEALAIARTIQATPDADLHRAATGLSLKAILSLTVLVGQLDELARSTAAHLAQPTDHDTWAALQERLIQWGYLPLPQSPGSQEASNGQS